MLTMNQGELLEELVAAVQQVGVLEKELAYQLQIVQLLEHYGRDTTVAKEALAPLEREYRLNSMRRNKIRLLLKD